MSEKVKVSSATPPSDQGITPGDATKAQEKPWPTREERLSLIRAYQAKALERSDPHVANLEVMDGDVMLVALWARLAMEAALIKGPEMAEGARRLAQQADMFLRCIHQVSRDAGIIRQLTERKAELGPEQ